MANNTSSLEGVSYVEWGSVIAGTVIACAVSVLLLQFGQAIGLSIPERFDDSYTAMKVLVIGLWLLWVQLMASMSGGYLAGRMRATWSASTSSESEIRDGIHGLLVWALSTLVAIVAAALAAFLSALAVHYGVDAAQEAHARANSIPEALAHKYAVIFGFSAVASSIVSAIAAYWMGTVGGDHRDGELDLSRFSFRRKIAGNRR
jgi:hypothetical protein